ncbi:hypothetical protein F7R15_08140 [Pseudomonas reinekei]|uniref:Uncharacterized protein n=1 Tax=Pseudomonas reinekei TaxID=395598 RepID=A0A6H9RLS6_PSERE|nr:hypothetical protein F7R15_08140 [Pseudomonas reinekei]
MVTSFWGESWFFWADAFASRLAPTLDFQCLQNPCGSEPAREEAGPDYVNLGSIKRHETARAGSHGACLQTSQSPHGPARSGRCRPGH